MSKVFITGGTGVVGSALAPLFLNESQSEVHLLVRAKDDAHLEERRRALLAFWREDLIGNAESRLVLHRGDVSEPRLGLSERDFDQLASGLTQIVHSAASVRMDMSREQAKASCLTPVEEILGLFEHAQGRGANPKLDCVSTLGVAGRLKGLVPELATLPKREFHNSYEWAKAEAEKLLLWRIAEGAAITMHRPSMVVGHSASSKVIHRQIFYHLCRFLSGSATFGFLPDLGEVTLDLVPCDYVAKAIHWSSRSEATKGQVLHLCAGPEGAVPLMALAAEVREASVRHGRRLPTQRLLPFGAFETAVSLASRLPGKTGRRFSALGRFLTYAYANQSFASAESQALLAPNIGPAPAYRQFLAAQLDAAFAEESGDSEQAASPPRSDVAYPKGALS